MARTFTAVDVANPTTFNLPGTAIDEASGLCASRRHPGHVYTHGDSGNPNVVYAINTTTGGLIASLTLSVSMIDWEDIAYYYDGVDHWIVVADVGNNAGSRTNQKLIAFKEPATLTSQTITCITFPLVVDSPGTSRDCETLMIRPSTGETFLYMKANAGVTSSGLYQGPDWADLQQGATNHYVQILNHDLHQVTGGEWGDDDYYVLNTNGSDPLFDTYGGMYVFDNTHTLVDSFEGHKTTPTSPSEAVCWSADGNTMFRTFDGGGTAGKPVYAYPVTWADPPAGDPAILEPYLKVAGGWLRLRDGILTNPGGSLPKIPVQSATTFRSWFGVRILPSHGGSTHEQLLTPEGLVWLTDLNPGFITTKWQPDIATNSQIISLLQNLANLGIRSTLTVGAPFTTYSSTEWTTMMQAIEVNLANCLLMVNGQNEVNHIRGGATDPPGWETDAQAHQIELWNRMQVVNTNLSAIGKDIVAVGSPCLWSGQISVHDADLPILAPLVRDYCTDAHWHLYQRGHTPDWKLDDFIAQYQAAYPGKTLWDTENGYGDAQNYVGGSAINTQATIAIYDRKMWLECALREIRFSRFELLDDVDPTNADREANLGLIETASVNPAGWSAKPTYTALKAMNDALPGGGVDGQIGCRIETTSSDIYYVAVNHDTGTRLFLWTRDDIEDTSTKPPTPISVPNRSVTITDASGSQTVNVGADIVEIDLAGTVT